MKDTTLKQLVRDRKGNPRGMVIATVVNNTVQPFVQEPYQHVVEH